MTSLPTYQCSQCNSCFSLVPNLYLCPHCSGKQTGEPLGGILEVINYPSPDLNNVFSFLPVEKQYFPPVIIGDTPMWKVESLSPNDQEIDIYVKNDAQNLTGSTKDRASYLITALAKKYQFSRICVASTGNAASSQAGISASAGFSTIVIIPAKTPSAKILQCQQYGAKIFKVKGCYDDAYQMSLEYGELHRQDILSRNTAYHPLTIEGKKTISLEIFKDLGKIPDYVFIPAGDGVILSGVYKGFKDLLNYGFSSAVPKIIAVQSENSCGLYNGLHKGRFDQDYHAHTVADSLAVNIPRAGYLAVKCLKEYNGEIVLVSDQDILSAQQELSLQAGVFAEPSAAASYAGLKKYSNLESHSSVVLLITGSGFKDITAAKRLLPQQIPIISDVEEIDFRLVNG